MLGHLLRVAHGKLRAIVNKVTRPKEVTLAQHHHLKANPDCAACLSTTGGQAHHIEPFHKFPGKGALPSNFITLCEKVGGFECHLRIGHGGNFKKYNPHVVADAAAAKRARTPAARALIEAQAKNAALPDKPE